MSNSSRWQPSGNSYSWNRLNLTQFWWSFFKQSSIIWKFIQLPPQKLIGLPLKRGLFFFPFVNVDSIWKELRFWINWAALLQMTELNFSESFDVPIVWEMKDLIPITITRKNYPLAATTMDDHRHRYTYQVPRVCQEVITSKYISRVPRRPWLR